MDKLESQPPALTVYEIAFPAPHVLLVTINRERAMNAIHHAGHHEGDRLFRWFDDEPSLRVAVITGKGRRAFSAGQDLKLLLEAKASAESGESDASSVAFPTTGFAGLSRRLGKKPVIAAVNGVALGGGFELVLNCDMAVAAPHAVFALPEARRGVWAAAGGIPRVVRQLGMQLASEIVLAGRELTAAEAAQRGLVARVVDADDVVAEAVALAVRVADMSPDSVVVSRAGLREAWETASVERAAQITEERLGRGLMMGDNLRIGLMAFAAREKPEWVPSKL